MRRTLRPRHPRRGPGRRPGGDAVVDDHHPARLEVEPGPVAPVLGGPALEFLALAVGHELERELVEPRRRQHLVVLDLHAPFAQRAHGQLGLEGDTELAHHDHVERDTREAETSKATGTPPRGSPRTTSGPDPGSAERVGQLCPGVAPVREPHLDLLLGDAQSSLPRHPGVPLGLPALGDHPACARARSGPCDDERPGPATGERRGIHVDAPEGLNSHQRDTLAHIFRHPSGSNIEWHSVLSLLNAVATV